MANKPKPKQDEETGRFVSGNIGGGRPKGSRNKLGEDFIQKLQEDFDNHGAKAIETVRQDKPDAYLKVIASLLPRDFNVNVNKFEDLSDEQLTARLRDLESVIRHFLGAPRSDGDSGGTEETTRH